MTEKARPDHRLAAYLSSEIHADEGGIEIYGTSASNDQVYIEGDIDGEEFEAVVMVMSFSIIDRDDDIDQDEDVEEEE